MLIGIALTALLLSVEMREPLRPGHSRDGVTYIGSELRDGNEGTYLHRIRVAGQRGTDAAYSWQDHASAFYEFRRFGGRIALLGSVGTSGDSISLVDSGTGASIGFILCRDPKFSPDSHRISYLNFIPRQAPEKGSSDVLLEIESSMEAVPRLGGVLTGDGWVVESANRGRVVYPPAARGTRVFPQTSSKQSEMILDRIWATNSKLVTLVFGGRALSIVEAVFNPAASAPNIRTRILQSSEFGAGKTVLSLEDLRALQPRLEVRDGSAVLIRFSRSGQDREISIPIR